LPFHKDLSKQLDDIFYVLSRPVVKDIDESHSIFNENLGSMFRVTFADAANHGDALESDRPMQAFDTAIYLA
jgi:hypothetical protein